MASTLLKTVSVIIAVLAGIGVVAGIWWTSRTTDTPTSPRAEALRALAVAIFLIATGISIL